jgi:acyl transferase domain-containing protein
MAGMTKVLLQMKHRQLVPAIHADQANPNIEFEKSPFYLQRELVPWQSSDLHPRRSLVNSFGAGGVNACVVLEEYGAVESPMEYQAGGPYVFTLSARNEQRLRDYASRLLVFLQGETHIDLAALCYTLQVGREAMQERLAIVVSDKSGLIGRLRDWSACESSAQVYRGSVGSRQASGGKAKRGKSGAAAAGQRGAEGLAQVWVAGGNVSWEGAYGESRPARISLPTYPFAKERYWVSDRPAVASRATLGETGTQLHPLVSHNSSTLSEVSFTSRLADTAFYAADHRVNGVPVFPGAGFLEIASVCGTLAAEQTVRRIRDVVWIQPLGFPSGPQVLRTFLRHIGDGVEYAITSLGEDCERVVHSEGRLIFGDATRETQATDGAQIQLLKQRCKGLQSGAQLYQSLARCGLDYGAALQIVKEVHVGDSCVLSRLELAESLKGESGQFVLHPAIIDGALQTVAALFAGADSEVPYLPFALDEVDIVRPLAQVCYAFAEVAPPEGPRRSDVRKFDVSLFNERGDLLVRLRSLYVRRLDDVRMSRSATASR